MMMADALARAEQDVTDVDVWRAKGLIGSTDTKRGPLAFFRHDTGALTQSLQAYGEWAELEIGFCSRFLTPGDTVLDVGAYIGTHSVAFAECVGPAGQVYSFEAQPASFALLAHNLAAHAISQVTAANAAVGGPNPAPPSG